MIRLNPKTGRIGFGRDDGSIEWFRPEDLQVLDADGKPPPSEDVIRRVALGRFAPKLWQAFAPFEAARLKESLEESERLRPLIEVIRAGGSVADMTDKPTIELHVAEVDALLRLALPHRRSINARRSQDRRTPAGRAFLAFLENLPPEVRVTLRTLHDLRTNTEYLRVHSKKLGRDARADLLRKFIQRGT